jgi:hypothetical protein
MSLAATPWTLPPATATQPYTLRSGHVVQIWAPRPGEAHLPAWYEPAIRNRRDADQLRFLGRIERGLLPALWLYVDEGDGDELLVDVDGVAHTAHDDLRRRVGHRFDRVDDRSRDPVGAVVLPFRPRSPRGAEPMGEATGKQRSLFRPAGRPK